MNGPTLKLHDAEMMGRWAPVYGSTPVVLGFSCSGSDKCEED
jgi:hypothetical protein